MSKIKEEIKKCDLNDILLKKSNIMIETTENIFHELISRMLIKSDPTHIDTQSMTINKLVLIVVRSNTDSRIIRKCFQEMGILIQNISVEQCIIEKIHKLNKSRFERPSRDALLLLNSKIIIETYKQENQKKDKEFRQPAEKYEEDFERLQTYLRKSERLENKLISFEKLSDREFYDLENKFEDSKALKLEALEKQKIIKTGIHIIPIKKLERYIQLISGEYEVIFFDLDGIIEDFGKNSTEKIQPVTESLECIINEAYKIICVEKYLTQRSFIFLKEFVQDDHIRVVSIKRNVDIILHKQLYSYIYENKWIDTLIDKLKSNKVILFVSYDNDIKRMKKYINDYDKIHKSHIIDNLICSFTNEHALLRIKDKFDIENIVIFANLISKYISWSEIMKSFQHLTMINEIHIIIRINQKFYLDEKDGSFFDNINQCGIKFMEETIQWCYNIQILESFGLNKYIITRFKKGTPLMYEYLIKDAFYHSFIWNAYYRILSVNYLNDIVIPLLCQLGYDNTKIIDKGTCHRIIGYSRVAIQWLEFMSIHDNTYIRHETNEGEFRIPSTRYRADGYSSKLNKIYEFYGDVYHGNPKSKIVMKNPNKIFFKSTFAERYQKTIDREKRIKSLGFDLEVIWEQDWENIIKSIIIIQRWWRSCHKNIFVTSFH
jgi:hypothetical protein